MFGLCKTVTSASTGDEFVDAANDDNTQEVIIQDAEKTFQEVITRAYCRSPANGPALSSVMYATPYLGEVCISSEGNPSVQRCHMGLVDSERTQLITDYMTLENVPAGNTRDEWLEMNKNFRSEMAVFCNVLHHDEQEFELKALIFQQVYDSTRQTCGVLYGTLRIKFSGSSYLPSMEMNSLLEDDDKEEDAHKFLFGLSQVMWTELRTKYGTSPAACDQQPIPENVSENVEARLTTILEDGLEYIGRAIKASNPIDYFQRCFGGMSVLGAIGVVGGTIIALITYCKGGGVVAVITKALESLVDIAVSLNLIQENIVSMINNNPVVNCTCVNNTFVNTTILMVNMIVANATEMEAIAALRR